MQSVYLLQKWPLRGEEQLHLPQPHPIVVRVVAELDVVVVVVSVMFLFNLITSPCMHFIPPTSNICERFFSLAKLVYSDLRKAVKHTTWKCYCIFLFEPPFVGYGNGIYRWLETRVAMPILTMFLMRSSLDITLTLILKSTLAHSK